MYQRPHLRSSRVIPCTNGFTLIELLVTIAIIALLASMTLAVIGQVRKMAKSTVCSSNLRQIGLCGLLYAGDWEGVLPQHSRPGELEFTGGWEVQIRSYLADKSLDWQMQDAGYSKVYRCPTAVAVFPNLNPQFTTYGLNIKMGGSLDGGGWSNPCPVATIARVSSFQRAPWFTEGSPYPGQNPLNGVCYSVGLDCWDPGIGQFVSPWPWNQWSSDISGYGRGHASGTGINMVFIDGHVEMMRLETFRALSTSEQNAMR